MRKRPRMSASPLLALFLLFLASTVSAIGPPTNPLDLFVRYDVGWVDQNTGRFGGNLTFFRPQTAKFDANWALIVKFPGDKTSVETFSGVEQWSIEKNSDKSYRISIKDETILSADAALVAEDNTRNLRRFTFFFNGRVTAPASKADLFPTEYRLMAAITDPNAPTLPMVDQKDFTNRDLVRGTPNQPFGPFAAAQTNRIEVSSAGVDPDNPSPKGTDLATGPIGLGIYLGIFTIAGTVFTIGTIDRARYRSQFLKQMSQEAMPVKNEFVN